MIYVQHLQHYILSMIVGFTGTREGLLPGQESALREYLGHIGVDVVLHHGDCVGADAKAHQIAVDLGITQIIIHPPSESKLRARCGCRPDHGDQVLPPKSYLQRNHDIVDASEVLLACPKTRTEELRSGTWATIRYARSLGREVVIMNP